MKALVTGAARGIGAAIAARLREEGIQVVTLDREPGCDLQVDLRRDELPPLGDIDACVANAAITTTVAPAHRMTAEQWDGDIAVNLTGAFRTVQACLRGMRERGFGRIVLISSMAAKAGLPGQVAYTASKAGLLGMMRTLAAEGATRGITCNAVLPGLVATEAVLELPRPALDALVASLPTGRLTEPGEVAAAVAFLVSRDAGQVTAQEIAVDGGWSLNTASLAGRRDTPD